MYKNKIYDRSSLIPLLQEIQSEQGFISEEAIKDLGRRLDISTTKIYSLASFYDGFRFSARGKIHIRICSGTSCYINKEVDIESVLKEELKLKRDVSTPDGKYSIEFVDCMGACHLGPLIAVNDNYFTVRSEQDLRGILRQIKSIEIDEE